MYLKFNKVRDVKAPERAHATDAGIDFYLPTLSDKFIEVLQKINPKIEFISEIGKPSEVEMIIPAGESILIPGGIKMEVPFGYMGLFLNKSGVASKKKLLIGAQVIDTFYSGEVHINLNNVSKNNTSFKSGDKLAQLVMVPILCCDLMEVSEDKLYDKMTQDSNRGEAGFGSTDKK